MDGSWLRRAPDKGRVDDLTREFIAESQEGLERMERCLTELEKRPGDRRAGGGDLPRGAHDQGDDGFSGIRPAGGAGARGREPAGALRDGKIAVTGELIGGLLELLDGLRAILRAD